VSGEESKEEQETACAQLGSEPLQLGIVGKPCMIKALVAASRQSDPSYANLSIEDDFHGNFLSDTTIVNRRNFLLEKETPLQTRNRKRSLSPHKSLGFLS